jgi:lipopolysaccharide transport system ATP-binding protein
MTAPIIEIKNLGKKYNITHERGRYVALRDVMANVFKSPFSFLKTKVKRVTGLEKKEEFWALSDINFNVQPGEVVGIIGKNGAGKSTLLKVLSQITPPTTGEIRLHGRVGSLLEVGTGFHPELTGRENIFLNGAILGMKKTEIARKFDEIVAFAGIEKFLDTPVKHFSSGMYVRLAFSVAAHMEPDILIVDEVLAVGDAEFQKKSLGKLDEITKKDGRTILFVSHNMSAIQQLCTRVIVLKDGAKSFDGETSKAIEIYNNFKQTAPALSVNRHKKIYIENFEVKAGTKTGEFVFNVDLHSSEKFPPFEITIVIRTVSGENITTLSSKFYAKQFDVVIGLARYTCSTRDFILKPGSYAAHITINGPSETYDYTQDPLPFEIMPFTFYSQETTHTDGGGSVLATQTWKYVPVIQ